MQDFFDTLFSSKAKPTMGFTWPTASTFSHWNPIPRKYRLGRSRRRPKPRLLTQSRYFVNPESSSGKGATNNVAALQISFNPVDGIRHLRQHRWSIYDAQHLITILFVIFSFLIAPIPLAVCIAIVVAYSFLVLAPATRQFFLPSMSIWAYLLYFFCSRFIPVQYRPHIWVKVLPALENVLYGANLSNILSAHTHPLLDLLAWIPYGLLHFGLPVFTAAILFIFAAPGTTRVFALCFGYLSLIGVTTQLLFPCTPPWYELANGLAPAHYGMPGSPAGLARVDKLLGVDMYTTSFSTAPVPFGAFPSLHAADATLEALFLGYCFPRFRVFFIAYVGWIWWATMYLNHHYAVDLVAGSLLSAFFYYVSRSYWLPRRQLDKRSRWEYDYIEIGEKSRAVVDEYSYNNYQGFDLGLLPQHNLHRRVSDEWTIGSSSSFATTLNGSTSGSASVSGSVSGGSRGQSSPGTMSPITPEAEFRPVTIFGMTPQGHVWDGGNTGRDSELAEVAVVR